MPAIFSRRIRPLLLVLLCAAGPGAGAATTPADPIPLRFLLSFDDGPSAAVDDNPTAGILDVLARNAAQPGVKAIFFVQTRAANAGASEIGASLLRREHDEGHLLAFHTATPRHSNHRSLGVDALELSLRRGAADLQAVTGTPPSLLRPPFWNYDADTLAAYHRHGLHMLLTDLSANDGKIWGVNFSWHKRSNMLAGLTEVRRRWRDGAMPAVDGSVPVVVTFHDINTYTARHIEEYLLILLDVARELELPLADPPFYNDRGALEKAALARAVRQGDAKPALPGLWNWLWN
ncbi:MULTISPECIES: polysaccharide deacetylase family protein [unclassified Janthinobacterium]|uniref:polysaccharide deacetylase family protein n=1 Tax=unclassified Janthinobacterium TaxID=2610881 RepID=UPI000346CA7F|nr:MULTISPECIES: polysaccharide deacetylase family protein [unclassified Janthinobacterium]MEC5163281.1 peptidoglycan/xylan/chitin deacetylase (PgdA/CDA1 family) [Janthinobacterium sp. CG_S6]